MIKEVFKGDMKEGEVLKIAGLEDIEAKIHRTLGGMSEPGRRPDPARMFSM